MSIFGSLFGDANQKFVKSVQPPVEKINNLEKEYELLSDVRLKEKTAEFRKRLEENENLDDLLPEAFAAVREAAKRTLNQRHFDVQLVGGIVLHQGRIAEMKTGEGKTLTATLAVYLNTLSGNGVHVITVNDYLARRDTVWMGQIYNALGLTVGCINHDSAYLYDPGHTEKDQPRDEQGSFKVFHEFLRPVTRREAYEADITYGTNNEFGFDYLRDNMAYEPGQMVQAKGHNFAIVDEVDSILIDEARTPLIISAPDAESGELYRTFAKIIPRLRENEDYNIDEKLKAVSLTDAGITKVEQALGIQNIYDHGGMRQVHHLEQALKAQVLFKRDKDYVVKDGEVVIVDEFTGRLMPGRRWSEGLHQAVEAKEGVAIQKESRTLATITFQNYFRMYKKLAGMTGTAATSSEEFHKVYNLEVIIVPTNKPMVRQELSDRIYKNQNIKWKAVVEEIKQRHFKGQPVLVGTVSIEKNELLSSMLKREGIPHNVLNAKNHESEGQIIAQAGKPGQVTVATNMAGRGVDIVLGGNPSNSEDAQRVREVGGLHIIGTERHEARRIDNQLRGRSGRQGDPGSSQFFISLDDDVVRIFGGERIKNLMERLGFPEEEPIEHSLVSKSIEQAQGKIEGHHFDARKYVLEFDNVMNKHRETIYGLRKELLSKSDYKSKIKEYIKEFIDEVVEVHTAAPEPNLKELEETAKAITNKELRITDYENPERLKQQIKDFFYESYDEKERQTGEVPMRNLEKFVLLRVIDELWVEHLEAMDYLRNSVGLRAYGQRDPLVEYRIEGQKMFEQLLRSVKYQVVNLIFKVGIQVQASQPAAVNPTRLPQEKEIGRNDPCWCGAKNPDGNPKKYKKCHGK